MNIHFVRALNATMGHNRHRDHYGIHEKTAHHTHSRTKRGEREIKGEYPLNASTTIEKKDRGMSGRADGQRATAVRP